MPTHHLHAPRVCACDEHETNRASRSVATHERGRASFARSRSESRACGERERERKLVWVGYYIIYFALIHSHAREQFFFALWLVVYGQHTYAVYGRVCRACRVRLSSLWRVCVFMLACVLLRCVPAEFS